MASNLDLLRSIFADWQRGDFSSADWAHPDIEYEIADGPAPGSWKGLAEMAKGWRDFLSAWEDFRTEAVDEYGERVLALQQFSARSKTSGVDLGQLRMRGASLFQVHGGKVIRLVLYWDRERALAELGLPPEAGSQPA